MKLLGVIAVCLMFISGVCGCVKQGYLESNLGLSDGIAIPASNVPAETYVINSPGRYFLTGTRLCKGTGIDVYAQNVTIDLMGNALIGPGKDSGENYGIRTNNHQNLEVINGTIKNFGDRGIVDRGEKRLTGYKRIVNMRVMDNGACGICIGGPGNLIKDCICSGNGVSGICPGWRSTIVGCICHANEHHGIHAGRGSIISGNNTSENGYSGIVAYCGSVVSGNCLYMNNRSDGDELAGMIVMDGCLIKDNTFRDNHISNILVKGKGNTIEGNSITALQNPGIGISLVSKDNFYLENQFYGNKAETAIIQLKEQDKMND